MACRLHLIIGSFGSAHVVVNLQNSYDHGSLSINISNYLSEGHPVSVGNWTILDFQRTPYLKIN